MNSFENRLYSGVKEDWKEFFTSEKDKEYYKKMIHFLQHEYTNKPIYPDINNIYHIFKLCSLSEVKVIIIGQDPYHTKDVADGLAFSSQKDKIPPSLRNIFKEIESDINIKNTSPSLINWAKQGVFLLNTALSVENGKAKSHSKIGWKTFVENLIKHLDNNGDYIFVLWGNDAKSYAKHIYNGYIIEGTHPSPLAGKAFFNQNYFSRINNILKENNKVEIDWSTNNDVY